MQALRTIYPDYVEALQKESLVTLSTLRQEQTERLFNEIIGNGDHKLHSLLPVHNSSPRSPKRTRKFSMPVCKNSKDEQIPKKFYHVQRHDHWFVMYLVFGYRWLI